MKKIGKRIKKYIENDRPQKLKSMMIKHRIDINERILGKGQSLLHYGVKKCAFGIVGFLLKSKIDLTIKNDKGLTAVEVAIRKSFKSKKSTALKIYEEMVIPLVDNQPSSKSLDRKIKNKLKILQDKLFHKEHNSTFYCNVDDSNLPSTESDSEDESEEDVDSEDDDKRWNEKMTAEIEEDFLSSHGRYEGQYDEDFQEETEKETYDQWAYRIHKEYKTKLSTNRNHPYRRSTNSTNQDESKTENSKQKIKEEKLRQRRKELEKIYEEKQKKMKEIEKIEAKYKYEEKYRKLFKSKGDKSLIRFCDVPWPFTSKLSEIFELLFCDLPDKNSDMYRKYLRDQQIRWHPDKFKQNFGEFLHEHDREKILQRVTEISQSLNQLSEKT
ncbi:hypothetical protein LOTGIDRAFT_172971 [Lottia gigantea]|uniref:NF-kappa-B inhibitor-like protein 1 n=1 Tax=Lottia gigantea TaxID=225164 RepID=V4AUA9_LOTGI|nr:hypothetical protein LOTGIDRAFT_172971 [Lottia gigantea]ESP00873.1 hypothetical protein LOTGIDRAFT_172971 [Lottia gigantea]